MVYKLKDMCILLTLIWLFISPDLKLPIPCQQQVNSMLERKTQLWILKCSWFMYCTISRVAGP